MKGFSTRILKKLTEIDRNQVRESEVAFITNIRIAWILNYEKMLYGSIGHSDTGGDDESFGALKCQFLDRVGSTDGLVSESFTRGCSRHVLR